MNQRPLIVGFSGYKRSGKDTAAAAFAHCMKISFAEPIKQMLNVAGILTVSEAYGEHKERPIDWLDDITPRRVMETLGTQWGRRMIHKDLWVRLAEYRARLWRDHGDGRVLVFADVRMKNEAAMIRDMGGMIVHIRRGTPEGFWARLKRRFGPLSERGLEVLPGDVVIYNNGTIEDLHRDVLLSCNLRP